MVFYLEEIELKDYLEEKRLIALATRVCLLKGTIIGNTLYEQLNKGKGRTRWTPKKLQIQREIDSICKKKRKPEVDISLKKRWK